MTTFRVNPAELTRIADMMLPTGSGVSGAGTAVGDAVAVPVGLAALDGALSEVGSALGGWLTREGSHVETLAYNAQVAGDVYAASDEAAAAGAGTPQPPGPGGASAPGPVGPYGPR